MWDSDDRAYLDFSQGNGANSLGHSPRVLIKALSEQTHALINPGMGLHTALNSTSLSACATAPAATRLICSTAARKLCEAAIKLARKWGQLHPRRRLSHHQRQQRLPWPQFRGAGGIGRTLETVSSRNCPVSAMCLSTTCRPCTLLSMRKPLPSCLSRSRAPNVTPATEHYLKGVERLCRRTGILLILDEVQTGLGRCGTLLAEQQYGVRADIITLGKEVLQWC